MIDRILAVRPDPDQVIQPMKIDKSVSHDSVQLLGRLSPLGTPPEPKSVCLVEGSPEHGDVLGLKSFELERYSVQVSEQSGVFFSAGLDCFGDVEVGLVGVEDTCSLRSSKWGEPMPFKRNDSLSVC